MRKIYLFMMVTLDGYFEGEGHDISWHNVDNEFNDFANAQLEESGALLFGKRTYDLMAGFWPTPQGQAAAKETADLMNALPKFVASDAPFEPAWSGTTVLAGDVAGAIVELKGETGKDIALLGSNMLCVSLMEKDLVDEFRIMVNPRAIGKGTPLFAGLTQRKAFALRSSRAFQSGNVLNTYTLK